MKALLIISLVAIGLFVLFQTYISMATQRTEVQPYTVVKQEKEFEIRYYPPAILATYHAPANSYDKLS
ncbi:MAG: hypothetical protein K2Q22_12675, partial [Cytophagales bacterium]|nr:hypothetical protein [Cytophagales bacterium]